MDPFMSYRTGGRCRGQKPQYESCDFVGLIVRVAGSFYTSANAKKFTYSLIHGPHSKPYLFLVRIRVGFIHIAVSYIAVDIYIAVAQGRTPTPLYVTPKLGL